MASRKNVLKINNIIKIRSQKPTTMLVMLLRMLYLCLSKLNASKFALQRILKISSAKMISSQRLLDCQPACFNTQQHQAQGSSFSHNQCIISGFTNLLFRRRFIHCTMAFPFIPYYLVFFSKKVRNHKNLSIGIYLHIINSECACGYYFIRC